MRTLGAVVFKNLVKAKWAPEVSSILAFFCRVRNEEGVAHPSARLLSRVFVFFEFVCAAFWFRQAFVEEVV